MAKNRKNVYVCGKAHRTVTIDIDDGVTPMQIRCTHSGCKSLARSAYYQVEQNLKPTHEWYRPATMSGLSPNDVVHVKNGGLLLRKI